MLDVYCVTYKRSGDSSVSSSFLSAFRMPNYRYQSEKLTINQLILEPKLNKFLVYFPQTPRAKGLKLIFIYFSKNEHK